MKKNGKVIIIELSSPKKNNRTTKKNNRTTKKNNRTTARNANPRKKTNYA